MIIKNNKCGKIFTKSKYIFLQSQAHVLLCAWKRVGRVEVFGRSGSRMSMYCISSEHLTECNDISRLRGSKDLHKVRMYTLERYENIKVKTQTSVKEENIRKI